MFQTGTIVFGVLYMIATLLGLLNLAGYMLQLNDRVIGSAGLPIGIMVSCLSEMCENFRKEDILSRFSFLSPFSLPSFSF